ncbi:hypothetical protein PDE_07203 [Penicillium oxalicum 114-2]|uniref:Uncharacterized protein n=1 Tax=Penicillium oxalicum (strain 114-2 / CGMCC 5302) TaxID=933388 RepID=S8B0G1_PENO1|nr:hypothetical protein PDE_07203 [Penicillium oxalicum 114-2]
MPEPRRLSCFHRLCGSRDQSEISAVSSDYASLTIFLFLQSSCPGRLCHDCTDETTSYLRFEMTNAAQTAHHRVVITMLLSSRQKSSRDARARDIPDNSGTVAHLTTLGA